MITNWFMNSDWRVVGRLPKKYERNLFLITPYVKPIDYFRFYLAISSITNFSHQLFIQKKWYSSLLFCFFKRRKTFFKPSKKELDEIFTKRKVGQRQINIVFGLSSKGNVLKNIDLEAYHYAKNNHIPITLVTIDHVEKMVKLHTVFYPSRNFNRDMNFINRYFLSHEKKNKNYKQSNN